MPTSPKTAVQSPMSRAEKLSILSTMLGPDAMARLRDGQVEGPVENSESSVEIDAERAAWQRNKLLERLRHQGTKKAPVPFSAKAENKQVSEVGNNHLDARLAKNCDLATLNQEHPAVIARLVKALPRDERVEVLKSLPGPIARSIVRRLR